jgi:predicted nucleic acid-binding protein
MLDACVLVPALTRNLLLSLAQAELFRPRWSARILDETEGAIARMLTERGDESADEKARKARRAMELAFEDAAVVGYEKLEAGLAELPDPNDRHVIAAAVKTKASIIVTDNLGHFPRDLLAPLDLEAKPADEFMADTVSLSPPIAAAAISRMRERLKRPAKEFEDLLLDLERNGLIETADMLREWGGVHEI